MTVQVKICGITNSKDADLAIECGADYLGFNFYPHSSRYLDPYLCKAILQNVPDSIGKVGLFVNCDAQLVLDMATEFGFDLLQFHGDEPAKYCQQFARPFIKAFRLQAEKDLLTIPEFASDYVLIDAFLDGQYGGTGKLADWKLAKEAKCYGPLFLSGGLNVGNLSEAIKMVAPFAVDIASGSESSPGKKDAEKMEKLVKIAKGLVHEV